MPLWNLFRININWFSYKLNFLIILNTGIRGRSISLGMSPDGSQIVEPKSLVNQLEYFFKQFQFFGLDMGYIEQIFMQLLYYICAISLNNLMLRQELCMWKTGMKIRYNVSCLEEWARKQKMVCVASIF